MTRSPARTTAVAAVALSAALAAGAAASGDGHLAPGPSHPTELALGSLPPVDLELTGLDGARHSTAEARGRQPLLLLFFRGVW